MKSVKKYFLKKKAGLPDILMGMFLFAAVIMMVILRRVPEIRFQSSIIPENIYEVRMGNDGSFYTLDQEHSRIIKSDSEGNAVFTLTPESAGKDHFSYADDIAVDDAGYLYVKEGAWTGMRVTREAVLRYDPRGKYVDTVLDQDYSDMDINKHRIYALSAEADGLYYIVCLPDAVEIHRGTSSVTVPYANAFNEVMDAHFKSDGTLVVLDKKGFFTEISGEGSRILSDTGKQEEQIVPYRFCIQQDGSICYTDIRNNTVRRLDQNAKDEVLIGGPVSIMITAGNRNGKEVLLTSEEDSIHVWENGNSTESIAYFRVPLIQKLGQLLEIVKIVLMILCFLILTVRTIFILHANVHFTRVQRRIFIMAFTVVMISGIMIFKLLSEFQTMYRAKLYEQIETSAYAIANQIESADLEAIGADADTFDAPAYKRISVLTNEILDGRIDFNKNIYCNILKYDGTGSAYAVYYLDQSIGTYYPLDETETEEVKQVYQTGQDVWNAGKADLSGSYMYIKAPILNTDRQVSGVVEIGTETYIFAGKIREFLQSLLATLIAVAMIIYMAGTEIAEFVAARDLNIQLDKGENKVFPAHIVRLLVFSIFSAYNMTASFLPVYIERRAGGSALLSSLPITVNLFFIGLMSLFCSRILRRISFRKAAMISIGLSLCGNLCIFVWSSYPVIFAGLLLDGIGVGIITNAIYIYLAGISDEVDRMRGFSVYNAGCLAGINFGMMFGAAFASYFSERSVFAFVVITWTVTAGILLVLHKELASFVEPEETKTAAEVTDTEAAIAADIPAAAGNKHTQGKGLFRYLTCRPVLSFTTLIQNPYIVINSFVFYFVPLFCGNNGYSETTTSILLLLYSVSAVYLGSYITRTIYGALNEKAIYLACALSYTAIMLYALTQNMMGLILALIILGISNSFGKSVQQTVFFGYPEVKEYGEDKAMGIYNFTENIGESAGPVVFGSLMNATPLLPVLGTFSGVLMAAGALHYRIMHHMRKTIKSQS